MFLFAFYVPHQWPAFAQSLAKAMNGDGAELYQIVSVMGADDMGRRAIACADTPPYSRHDRSEWPTAEGLADHALHELKNYSSRWALSNLVAEPDGGCQFWPTNKLEDYEDGTAAERFRGPWNVS